MILDLNSNVHTSVASDIVHIRDTSPIQTLDSVSEITHKILTLEKKNIIIPIAWVPWGWKWCAIKGFFLQHGFSLKWESFIDPHFSQTCLYDHKHWLNLIYINWDCFFTNIWDIRRTTMLESEDIFKSMYSDVEMTQSFLLQVINQTDSFKQDSLYFKTDEERKKSQWLSSIVVNPRIPEYQNVIIIDAVNAQLIAEKVLQSVDNTQVEVFNIMIKPYLWRAFQRLLKRDVFCKKKQWKPLDYSNNFRFEENFHIFNTFIIEQLYLMIKQSEHSYFLDYTHKKKKTHLTDKQRQDSIHDIELLPSRLLTEDRWPHFSQYVIDYSQLILNHLQSPL